ncbi:cytochrome P450 4V2-like [Styela clava]
MEAAFLTVSLVIAVVLVKLFAFFKDYVQKLNAFKNIPSPLLKAYPIIGHALQLRGDPDEMYEFLMKMIKDRPNQEDEVGIGWMGMKPVIVILGPKSAETLLHSTNHIKKSFFYDFLHSWLGTGLLTASGEKWKTRRRLLTPTFHFSILNDFLAVMNEQAKVFSTNLEKFAKTGETFNVCTPITLCTLDIICETAMGKSINAQDSEDSEYVNAIYRTSSIIQERQKSPWIWSDLVFRHTKYGKEYYKCLGILHGFTKSVIKEKMETFSASESGEKKPKRLAFLDMLLSVADDGKVLSFDDIREEVDTFMFEGHDTTAAALAWALHLIGAHPDVQAKIYDELDRVLNETDSAYITMENLKKLEYLEMVVKESLRILPSVPIIGRITSKDCEMDGHLIPAGTDCVLFTQAVNKNPNYWTDPESFEPDRFSSENSVGRHPYSYLPFSAGPRNCIGQRFALMEEKVVLAHLLRKYAVTSCDKTKELRLMGDIILRSRNGINIKLSQRNVD